MFGYLCPAIIGPKKPGITTGLDGELEKTVRNTLKKNSEKLQLVENNGQSGLPREVVAYFSSYNEMVFIEKNKLRIIVLESDAVNDKKKINQEKVLLQNLLIKNTIIIHFQFCSKVPKDFQNLKKQNHLIQKEIL